MFRLRNRRNLTWHGTYRCFFCAGVSEQICGSLLAPPNRQPLSMASSTAAGKKQSFFIFRNTSPSNNKSFAFDLSVLLLTILQNIFFFKLNCKKHPFRHAAGAGCVFPAGSFFFKSRCCGLEKTVLYMYIPVSILQSRQLVTATLLLCGQKVTANR